MPSAVTRPRTFPSSVEQKTSARANGGQDAERHKGGRIFVPSLDSPQGGQDRFLLHDAELT